MVKALKEALLRGDLFLVQRVLFTLEAALHAPDQ